ncbi:MAG: hypothetical protein ACOCXI_08980 [Chloroflexota bacterium]
MTHTTESPVYHVELAVLETWPEFQIVLLSQLPPARQQHLRQACAELLIPYHAGEDKYGFTCYVATVAAHVPAVVEAVVLTRNAKTLYELYGAAAEPMEV